MVDSGSSARATQPFPFVNTTTRCLSLSRSVAAAGGANLPPLMMPLHDDQYISLSPTDSPAEDGSFVINYEPTFQVTLKEEEALIPGPGLLLETRVRDSARLHHWSMRLLMRSDIPTGSWSLNMSCGSVDIWWNFTPFMSWWITEIWQTISDKTPPCPTGRQQQDGGTVASSSLVLTRRKRNYSSSPFPHLQGCIMCTPPGLAPLY